MPRRRPPRKWFRRTVARLRRDRSIEDPEAVAGNLWYNRMSAAARREVLAREGARKKPRQKRRRRGSSRGRAGLTFFG